MSLRLAILNAGLRLSVKRYLARASDEVLARARMEREARWLRWPRGARMAQTTLAGRPAASIDGPEGAPVLMWLHGGAYCLGSPRTHAAMVAALALRAGVRAVVPDYRLAPEHPFPAASDDALACYRALLDAGEAPGRIAVGGDSAGGGLALALLHQIGAGAVAAPAAGVLFSPWADLTLSGASLRSLARRDAFLPAQRMAEIRDLYLAGADPRDPRASPHLGSFAGGPPVLVLASRAEILLDDARMVEARLRADGVEVALDLWDRVPHAWPLFQGWVPEADRALDRAAGFLREALAQTARR